MPLGLWIGNLFRNTPAIVRYRSILEATNAVHANSPERQRMHITMGLQVMAAGMGATYTATKAWLLGSGVAVPVAVAAVTFCTQTDAQAGTGATVSAFLTAAAFMLVLNGLRATCLAQKLERGMLPFLLGQQAEPTSLALALAPGHVQPLPAGAGATPAQLQAEVARMQAVLQRVEVQHLTWLTAIQQDLDGSSLIALVLLALALYLANCTHFWRVMLAAVAGILALYAGEKKYVADQRQLAVLKRQHVQFEQVVQGLERVVAAFNS